MKKQLLDGTEIYTLDTDKGTDVKVLKWLGIILLVGIIYEVGFLTAVYCSMQ
jgi:hypothetical protein